MSDDGQVKLRVPDDLLPKLYASVKKSLRTIPMEIIFRLRESFEREEKEK
jgi:hypothetical protein